MRCNLDELTYEAVVKTCSVKKLLLNILQNSQESTCARVSFLIKLQASTIFYRTPPMADSMAYATFENGKWSNELLNLQAAHSLNFGIV